MKSFSFRYDINGLRGIAVLAVIIFHFNNNVLTGGFTGVDVFFVISGFLMTAIILDKLNAGNFSLFQFYKARVERIIPALLAVCASLLCIGFIFFEPETYQFIGQHSFSALTFFSNISYWKDSNYFDISSQYKFLLHSWSLSIEWQFYFFYPLFIISLNRFFKIKGIKYTIFIGFIISFLSNIFLIPREPTFSFFLLPTRMWELLAGSLAFLYPFSFTKNQKKTGEILGLGLILFAFLYIPKLQPWRSYLVFISILGAYLCILSNNPQTFLKNKIIQLIGTYSYSIYLTHWPIFVFFKNINHKLPFLIYILFTLISSYILHQFIEKKRNHGLVFLLLYSIVVGLSYYVSMNGIQQRVDLSNQSDQKNYHLHNYGGLYIPQNSIITHFNPQNNHGKPSFILIGDSHARQFGNYLRNAHYNFITILKDGCLSLPTIQLDIFQKKQDTQQCKLFYKNLQKTLNENQTIDLIIIQRWDLYRDYYNEFIHNKLLFTHTQEKFISRLKNEIEELINKNGKQRNYFLIGDMFTINNNIPKCKIRNQLPFYHFIYPIHCYETIPYHQIALNRTLEQMAKNIPNLYFIDPNKALCNEKDCRLTDNNHKPIFSDDNHLSFSGADFVGPFLWKNINMDKLK